MVFSYELIFVGQKDGGNGAVGFGDDVKFRASGGVIDGQKPRAVGQCHFIRVTVGGIKVAPITAHVPVNGMANVIGGDGFKGGGRDEQPPQIEFHLRCENHKKSSQGL